jgi:hypothetical protein
MMPGDPRPGDDPAGQRAFGSDQRPGDPSPAPRMLRGAHVFAVLRRRERGGAPRSEASLRDELGNEGKHGGKEPPDVAFPLAGCWSVPPLILFPLWSSERGALRRPARAALKRVALWRMRRLTRGGSDVPPSEAP